MPPRRIDLYKWIGSLLDLRVSFKYETEKSPEPYYVVVKNPRNKRKYSQGFRTSLILYIVNCIAISKEIEYDPC